MAKSPLIKITARSNGIGLENKLPVLKLESTEQKFLDIFGSMVYAVDLKSLAYQRSRKEKYLFEIEVLKKHFFEKLKDFNLSGYAPTERINFHSLKVFEDYSRPLNWTLVPVINNLREYIRVLGGLGFSSEFE